MPVIIGLVYYEDSGTPCVDGKNFVFIWKGVFWFFFDIFCCEDGIDQ